APGRAWGGPTAGTCGAQPSCAVPSSSRPSRPTRSRSAIRKPWPRRRARAARPRRPGELRPPRWRPRQVSVLRVFVGFPCRNLLSVGARKTTGQGSGDYRHTRRVLSTRCSRVQGGIRGRQWSGPPVLPQALGEQAEDDPYVCPITLQDFAQVRDLVLKRVGSVPPGHVTTYGDLWPGAPRAAGAVLAERE